MQNLCILYTLQTGLNYNIKRCDYLSDSICHLPSHKIINKGITGCGGTTLELKDDRNSLVLSPTKNLVISKASKDILGVTGDTNDFTIKNSLNENIISLPIFSLALYNKLSSIKRITIPEDTKYNIYTVAYGDILITVIGEVDNNDIENIQNHINDILKNSPNYKHTAISYDKDRLDLSKYDNVIFCEKDKVIEENIVK